MADAYQVVRDFEKAIAEWAGAKYGVAVSSCCNAIFLCLKYKDFPCQVDVPRFTYPGVAMAIVNSDHIICFTDKKWKGIYYLDCMNIIDSALRFRKGMYIKKTLWCLSFHYRKHLPIGRGGMILTNSKEAMEWLKMARYDGRREMPLHKDNATIIGWNMFMTPDQAARGLALFGAIKDLELPDLKVKDQNYPDLSKWRCFQ